MGLTLRCTWYRADLGTEVPAASDPDRRARETLGCGAAVPSEWSS